MNEKVESLHCIDCAYNLNGLPASGRCPECGRSVFESKLARRNPEIFRYEDRILKRESVYRVYRKNAFGLAIFHVVGIVAMVSMPSINQRFPDTVAISMVTGVFLCLAVGFGAHARVKHVESIKFARMPGCGRSDADAPGSRQ